MATLNCYNPSCSKGGKYVEDDNTDDSCQHHSGSPIFHEGYKYWSCCKKKTTDFTEFLNTPGCVKGKHNPVKPPEPEKKPPPPDVIEAPPAMMEKKPGAIMERPSDDLPKQELKVIVASSLKTGLAQHKKKMEEMSISNGEGNDEVQIGSPCRHNACEAKYASENSNNSMCEFHPGSPVFHEGYKFWTCCNKRTSDFDEFLKQSGCESGRHEWMKPSEVMQKKSTCRYDWHQTGKYTTITIYSKICDPEKCSIKVNPTSITASVSFNGGTDRFDLDLILNGVIDPDASQVEYMKTKAEIQLRKKDGYSWSKLEFTPE